MANPTPGTIIPKIQTSAQTTPTPPMTTPTTQATTPTTEATTPTTMATTPTTMATTPTTMATTPTTPPTESPTTPPLPPECGGGPRVLTGPSGYIETVGWPNSAYPPVADCSWDIVCPAGKRVAVIFEESFRVSGQMPSCTKDTLEILDCDGSIQYGPYCHLSAPRPIRSSCNKIQVVFKATNTRGDTRTGFRMNYGCVDSEGPTSITSTIPPPDALPEECGGGSGTLTAPSGSLQTVGWPNTAYPLSTTCSWNIVCPAGSQVEVSFESTFRIAGKMPDCPKDQLTIFDCEGNVVHGPFCHLSRPPTFNSTCNKINVVFASHKDRGSTRYGFRLNYRCTLPPPTSAPTATIATMSGAAGAPLPTVSPLCGGGHQIRKGTRGVIQTLDWGKKPYPTNTDCLWRVECPASLKVRLVFHSDFRVAGAMPECSKDQLNIYACTRMEHYGPFCHLTAPQPITTDCNSVDISFRAGDSRGSTRTGFRITYSCF